MAGKKNKVDEAIASIISDIDDAVRDLSTEEYIEFLNELEEEVGSRLEAAEG